MAQNLSENNVIKFISISKKKTGLFANFRAKGVRGGVVFSASISVDIDAAEVDPTHTLEDVIEECAKVAIKEFRRAELQIEGPMMATA